MGGSRGFDQRLRRMDRFLTGHLADLAIYGKTGFIPLKKIYLTAVKRRRQHPANPAWYEAHVPSEQTGVAFKVSWVPARGEMFITPFYDGRAQHTYRFRVEV